MLVFRSEQVFPHSHMRLSFWRKEICYRAGDVLSALVPAVIKPFAWFVSLLPGEVNSFAVISVAGKFLWGGVASPTPSPPPFPSGLGTGHGGVAKKRTLYFVVYL